MAACGYTAAVLGSMMGNRIDHLVDRLFWGREVVLCEECARELPAHDAVWRGLHAYCSTEHEAADALEAAAIGPPHAATYVPSPRTHQNARSW